MKAKVRKKISWHGLRGDVEQDPEISSLKGMSEAVRELKELALHEDLQRINP